MQVVHDAAGHVDGLGLVAGQVVAQTGDLGVHARPAQLLLVGLLSDGHLDQWRPAQEHAGAVLDHHGVIAHAGEVGASGSRGTEHHADGGDALGRELGQAAELFAPGHEHVSLAGQVGPSGLHQEHQGEAVLLGHVHGAQELANRGRARRPATHSRVVGDHEALRMGHLGQRHHDATPDGVAGVQPGEWAQFKDRGPRVRQSLEALADHHFAAGAVARHVLLTAAREEASVQVAHLVDQPGHGFGVLSKLVAGDGQARPESGAHAVASHAGRRFSRKAAIPSCASAPAKSSAEVVAANASPSVHACAGSAAQQLLCGTDGARRGLADRQGLGGDPGIERSLVGNDRREQPDGSRLGRCRNARR